MDAQNWATVLVALIGLTGVAWTQLRADKQRSLDREAETQRLAAQRVADEKRWADQRSDDARFRVEERAHAAELARGTEERQLRERRFDAYKEFLAEAERIRALTLTPRQAEQLDVMKANFFDLYTEVVLLAGEEMRIPVELVRDRVEDLWASWWKDSGQNEAGESLLGAIRWFREKANEELSRAR